MKIIYKYSIAKSIKITTIYLVLLMLFSSCGDTGFSSTGNGTDINVLMRADTYKDTIKNELQIRYIGHPDLKRYIYPIIPPENISNSYYTCNITYFNEDKNSKIILNNNSLFYFKNKTNKDYYIFYMLYGKANGKSKFIESYPLLKEVGFSFDYVNGLLEVYKKEDEQSNFTINDSILAIDEKTGGPLKYIDRFTFYEKLISAKYPYIKKIHSGEEYILKWE